MAGDFTNQRLRPCEDFQIHNNEPQLLVTVVGGRLMIWTELQYPLQEVGDRCTYLPGCASLFRSENGSR